MQDRAPLYPGRVKLIPVSGQTDVYDMVRADEPTQDGTALNKANLLTDVTAALFGLGTDAVPNDVLVKIKDLIDVNAEAIANGTKIATGSYKGTGTYGSSNPCKLTFDFVPRLVIIDTGNADSSSDVRNAVALLTGNPTTAHASLRFSISSSTISVNKYINTSVSGNTIRWYATATNSTFPGTPDMNANNLVYYYIAIGQ